MSLRQTLGLAMALGAASCAPTSSGTSTPTHEVNKDIPAEGPEGNPVATVQTPEEIICQIRAKQTRLEVSRIFGNVEIHTNSTDLAPLRAAAKEERDCLDEYGL